MPSERVAAIQAVVDAWNVPGIDPEHHERWKERLQADSPKGWPALARAVQRLVDVEATKNSKIR